MSVWASTSVPIQSTGVLSKGSVLATLNRQFTSLSEPPLKNTEPSLRCYTWHVLSLKGATIYSCGAGGHYHRKSPNSTWQKVHIYTSVLVLGSLYYSMSNRLIHVSLLKLLPGAIPLIGTCGWGLTNWWMTACTWRFVPDDFLTTSRQQTATGYGNLVLVCSVNHSSLWEHVAASSPSQHMHVKEVHTRLSGQVSN